jgi:hypothetical protein
MFVAFAWLFAACATREVPQHYPASSAASPDASVPKAAAVTTALASEPGDETDASDTAQTSPHAQHGGHHHAH